MNLYKSIALHALMLPASLLSAFDNNSKSITLSCELTPEKNFRQTSLTITQDGFSQFEFENTDNPSPKSITLLGKDGLNGNEDGIIIEDEITAFAYKTPNTKVLGKRNLDNGFDLNVKIKLMPGFTRTTDQIKNIPNIEKIFPYI